MSVEDLELALTGFRAAPFETEFRARVETALKLADAYLSAGDLEGARTLLDEEAAFAEKIFELVRQAGTPAQKREAAGGSTQLRDRARQLALVGKAAPEIAVEEWIMGEPATLADLRGRVVLLEFWATWCKPCREMFAKLKRLDEEWRARGLEIIALTRFYLSQRNEAASKFEELELMRRAVEDVGIKFRVGVSSDERTQGLYGATGLPTIALIDRQGLVRYAHFGGGGEANFQKILGECLKG